MPNPANRGNRLPIIPVLALILALLVVGMVGSSAGASLPGERADQKNQPEIATGQLAIPKAAMTLANAEPRGRILYVRDGSIWQWANNQKSQLTRGQHFASPAWSPDGKLIAASEVGDNHSDIVILDQAGRLVRRLTQHWSKVSVQQSAWGRSPTWSDDGSRIAYASDAGGLDLSLWSVSPDGSGARRLHGLYLGSGGLDFPAWSPDGRGIGVAMIFGGYTGHSEIFVYSTSDGTMRRLTTWQEGMYDPAWSPDGRHLAVAARSGGKTGIYVMRSDGSNMVRISEGPADRAPVWSPDGTHLAFLSLDGAQFGISTVRIVIDGAEIRMSPSQSLVRGENIEAQSRLSWAP
jgi:TolB protein